jgi:hypothetical protein
MKTIRLSINLAIILFILSACATAPATLSEKYNLDNQLENVPQIFELNLISWDIVDNQSFILQSNLGDYYLIILESSSNTLPFCNTINISNTSPVAWPNYNNVIVNDDGWEDRYMIEKIYKFRDYSQVESIKAQLSREIK